MPSWKTEAITNGAAAREFLRITDRNPDLTICHQETPLAPPAGAPDSCPGLLEASEKAVPDKPAEVLPL